MSGNGPLTCSGRCTVTAVFSAPGRSVRPDTSTETSYDGIWPSWLVRVHYAMEYVSLNYSVGDVLAARRRTVTVPVSGTSSAYHTLPSVVVTTTRPATSSSNRTLCCRSGGCM